MNSPAENVAAVQSPLLNSPGETVAAVQSAGKGQGVHIRLARVELLASAWVRSGKGWKSQNMCTSLNANLHLSAFYFIFLFLCVLKPVSP